MPDAPKSRLAKSAILFPLASVGILVAIFLIYYFPITSRQEAALNDRAFRSLSAASESLRNRVATYTSVFEQAAKPGALAPEMSPSAKAQDDTEKKIASYLDEQAPGLGLRPSESPAVCQPGKTTFKAGLGRDGATLEFRCGGRLARIELAREITPYIEGVPSQIFDEIVLTDSNGVVLYQTRRTGTVISNLASAAVRDTETTAKTGDTKGATATALSQQSFAAVSQASTLIAASLGGTAYKLYLSPVDVKLSAGDKSQGTLVLAGLIREKRFRAESLAVPGGAVVALALTVLIVIIAAWPLLKFTQMRATERIPRRSAEYFFLSTMGTVILVCVLGIHFRYIVNLREVDTNLSGLASAIEANFKAEVSRAVQVMDTANRSALYKSAMARYASRPTCVPELLSTRDNLATKVETRVLSTKGLQLSDYPYFDRLFFSDSNGNQHIKWETGGQATPATYVGDRDYYRATVNGDLWQFQGASPAAQHFRVDPVFSRNTGDYRAVISMQPVPAGESGQPPVLCSGNPESNTPSLRKDVTLRVFSMVTPLLSLSDPVMPPDYGFAIIDGSGNVLFHSTSAKSGRENLFNELDDASDMQVAVVAAQGKHLSARYLGFEARLFVTPFLGVQRIPWSMVVFTDLSASSAQNLERIVLFSILALIYFAVVAIALLLVPLNEEAPTWIWPGQAKSGRYLLLIFVLLLIAPAFYMLIFNVKSEAALILTALAIPLLSLSAGILSLKGEYRWNRLIALVPLTFLFPAAVLTRPHAPPLLLAWICASVGLLTFSHLEDRVAAWFPVQVSNSFAALCAMMLITTGVLPCVAFFRVAYDYHADLATRRRQIQTIAALEQREERVKERYRQLDLTATEGGLDVGRWLFLRRRLDQSTDRYDTVFLNLQGQVFTGDIRQDEAGPCREDTLPPELVRLASLNPFGRGTLTRNLSETPASSTESSLGAPGRKALWRWCKEGTNRIRLIPSLDDTQTADIYSLPPTRALVKSVSNDPVFLYPSVVSELPVLQQWRWGWVVAVFIPAWLITFFWVRPTLRSLFLLGSARSVEVFPFAPEPLVLSQNTILLALDPDRVASGLRKRSDVFSINFATLGQESDVDCSMIWQAAIVIEQFDYRLGSEEHDRKRLALLERLYFRLPDKPVLLLSFVDPRFYFASSEASYRSNAAGAGAVQASDTERWTRVFSRFTRLRAAGETPDHGRFLAASTWSECVALSQLAYEGWVNPRSKSALRHLQQRGLIHGTPFRFDDPEFRNYIRQHVSRSDRKAWEKQEDTALWDGIRLMFVVLLIGLVAAVMFLNQQTALSYVLTGLGVLTPLTKLLSEARSLRAMLGLGGKTT